jgi:pimeloyl-ACP methyl ester carboxylesterase
VSKAGRAQAIRLFNRKPGCEAFSGADSPTLGGSDPGRVGVAKMRGARRKCWTRGVAMPDIRRTKSVTVILVHGAFLDGSCWRKVIPILQEKGMEVASVQLPLISLAHDVDATRRAIIRARGPVVLVGHSWAGAVISDAGSNRNVKALIYVAAFAPEAGHSVSELVEDGPLASWQRKMTVDDEGFVSLSAAAIAEAFAHDLTDEEIALLAVTQGPISSHAFDEKVYRVAWEEKPSWYIVTEHDRMIDPAYQWAWAKRIKAKTTELPVGHVAMLSRPSDVAAVVVDAAEDTMAG